MKKHLFTALLLYIVSLCASNAQVETKYFPQKNALENGSFVFGQSVKNHRKEVKKYVVPSIDISKLLLEDEHSKEKYSLIRFGKGIDVSYTLEDGSWAAVDDGRLWMMSIESKEASSLNILFDEIFLPAGAELYIVNKDNTVLYGPVTSENLPKNKSFLTDVIIGSCATVCLFEPNERNNESRLSISRIVHGYRNLSTIFGEEETRAYSDCGIDVACYSEYEKESNAVARILISIESNYFWGSGALVMATNKQYKAYFLTAFHCADLEGYPTNSMNGVLSNTEISSINDWEFSFNYKKAFCGGTYINSSYTYNGATFRAAYNNTDFLLIELNQNVKQNSSISFLGWDRTGTTPTDVAGIHHPNGEVMEIALKDGYIQGSNSMWYFSYDDGTVRGGSSGSPLIDQNKKVIGQLQTGSNNPCGNPFATYGKFSVSWTGGGSDATRLSNWLDPAGTGQTSMNSSYFLEGTQIIGNRLLKSGNNVYYIDNLPDGLTVTWGLTDFNYYQNLHWNTPTTNQCTIIRSSSLTMSNATLTAKIWEGTTLLKTLVKTISGYPNFYGTYYNGVSTQSINLPNPLYVKSGAHVSIDSPYLINATASYSGDAVPSNWSFNSTTGNINFYMPSSGTIVLITVLCDNGETYYLPVVKNTNLSNFSVNVTEGQIIITLPEDIDTYSGEGLTDQVLTYNRNRSIEIFSVASGKKVFEATVKDSSLSVDTKNWKKGSYIVSLSIGKDTYSEKVIVK